MRELSIVAAVLFVAAVLIATHVTKRSLAALSQEEKAKLVDAAAKTPIWGFLALMVLLGVWITIVLNRPWFTVTSTVAIMVAFVALSITFTVNTYRRYRQFGLPPSFLKDFLISRSLRLAGVVLLFVLAGVWLAGVLPTA